jgi:N-acetylated-alpha-linked acidic dipeptidase
MRRFVFLAGMILVLAGLSASAIADEGGLFGYSAAASSEEKSWEEKFRAIPSPEAMRSDMQRLSARPHNVGSPYDADNAKWLAAQFTSYGWQTHIEQFDVLFPTPKERLVELVSEGAHFKARLREPAIPQDPTSNQQSEQLPTYNAYSIDGDVTAPLVYVNYGIPADYEQLDRMGVSVKGAIVIARYGHSWRGIKPKVAAEHGAIGCLVYSDPHEDGYSPGDTFPQGAFRPAEGVQRGSVADMPLYPGDPLTPGVGATKTAKRLDLKEAATITKIPVLPLSYADAQPLLAALTGPVAPVAWRGGLGITYHIGPGPGNVHLKVASNWDTKPVYDVIAKISGSQYPDEWIVRGNHHDAWVNGAEDPISGMVDELEEARALGELVKQGWKPKRTIIYCAWDGEEPGLLGSTEWAEEHADELRTHAVAYINSDSNGRGYLSMAGSHSLEHFINDIARGIQDPETKLSVWKRDQLRAIADASAPEKRIEARERPDLRIGPLGSGSDYTAFLQHDGIASLDLGFSGEDHGGIYHSIYDDFYWYTHFDDTDFTYGRALAQTAGSAVMRLVDAGLLPFEFTDFADTVQMYVRDLRTVLKGMQDDARERNLEITEGLFTATADPREKYVPPQPEAIPPYLNFAPLENAADKLTQSAAEYHEAYERASQNGGPALAPANLAEVNEQLMQSERRLLTSAGLPNRPWYRHQLYAPGYYTGYDAKTIPAVREAIEQKQWKEADEEIVRVGMVLEDESAVIASAAAKLSASVR